MSTEEIRTMGVGFSRLKRLIWDKAEKHKIELYEHYLVSLTKYDYPEAREEINNLIAMSFPRSPSKRKEYEEYVLDVEMGQRIIR